MVRQFEPEDVDEPQGARYNISERENEEGFVYQFPGGFQEFNTSYEQHTRRVIASHFPNWVLGHPVSTMDCDTFYSLPNATVAEFEAFRSYLAGSDDPMLAIVAEIIDTSECSLTELERQIYDVLTRRAAVGEVLFSKNCPVRVTRVEYPEKEDQDTALWRSHTEVYFATLTTEELAEVAERLNCPRFSLKGAPTRGRTALSCLERPSKVVKKFIRKAIELCACIVPKTKQMNHDLLITTGSTRRYIVRPTFRAWLNLDPAHPVRALYCDYEHGDIEKWRVRAHSMAGSLQINDSGEIMLPKAPRGVAAPRAVKAVELTPPPPEERSLFPTTPILSLLSEQLAAEANAEYEGTVGEMAPLLRLGTNAPGPMPPAPFPSAADALSATDLCTFARQIVRVAPFTLQALEDALVATTGLRVPLVKHKEDAERLDNELAEFFRSAAEDSRVIPLLHTVLCSLSSIVINDYKRYARKLYEEPSSTSYRTVYVPPSPELGQRPRSQKEIDAAVAAERARREAKKAAAEAEAARRAAEEEADRVAAAELQAQELRVRPVRAAAGAASRRLVGQVSEGADAAEAGEDWEPSSEAESSSDESRELSSEGYYPGRPRSTRSLRQRLPGRRSVRISDKLMTEAELREAEESTSFEEPEQTSRKRLPGAPAPSDTDWARPLAEWIFLGGDAPIFTTSPIALSAGLICLSVLPLDDRPDLSSLDSRLEQEAAEDEEEAPSTVPHAILDFALTADPVAFHSLPSFVRLLLLRFLVSEVATSDSVRTVFDTVAKSVGSASSAVAKARKDISKHSANSEANAEVLKALDTIRAEISSLRDSLEELEDRMIELSTQRSDLQASVADEARTDEHEKRVKKLSAELNKVTKQRDNLNRRMHKKTIAYSEKEKEADKDVERKVQAAARALSDAEWRLASSSFKAPRYLGEDLLFRTYWTSPAILGRILVFTPPTEDGSGWGVVGPIPRCSDELEKHVSRVGPVSETFVELGKWLESSGANREKDLLTAIMTLYPVLSVALPDSAMHSGRAEGDSWEQRHVGGFSDFLAYSNVAFPCIECSFELNLISEE